VSTDATHPHDRAVVIGIRRYADVAAGWITNLEGPDNDAAAVAEWLRSPSGGGLPHDNVRLVCSADVPDPFPDDRVEPNQRGLMAALDEIAQLPKNAYGQYAGRRLYVYVSGHGWAWRHDHAAVVTAEARKENRANVLVSSWLDWMRYSAPFEELVLWADTCASLTQLDFLQGCELAEKRSNNTNNVKLFSAFAAQLGLKAVENRMPDGSWHGAFTYALLEGLKGAATTPVTSDSLRNYLLNAMQGFMRDEQRADRTVAREPRFDRTDHMEFGTPPRTTFPVTLRFPPECDGRPATVGRGKYVQPSDETVLQGIDWALRLEAGVHVAYVDQRGFSQPFEVTGGATDAIAIAF